MDRSNRLALGVARRRVDFSPWEGRAIVKFMLQIQEQTAQYMLERERKHTSGIKFANSCISNQIMDPLRTVGQYVDAIFRKMDGRPEICALLNAIKYCNRMI